MTFCKIIVKHVIKDNKQIKIKYILNKLTNVYASYTARNRWVFNSLLNVTRQQVFFISAGREFHSRENILSPYRLRDGGTQKSLFVVERNNNNICVVTNHVRLFTIAQLERYTCIGRKLSHADDKLHLTIQSSEQWRSRL